MLRREPADLKSTFSIELRLVRNNLLGRDLFNCVHANRFAPCFLADTVQMNDGYAVTDFEHWSPRLRILSASRFIQPQSRSRYRPVFDFPVSKSRSNSQDSNPYRALASNVLALSNRTSLGHLPKVL